MAPGRRLLLLPLLLSLSRPPLAAVLVLSAPLLWVPGAAEESVSVPAELGSDVNLTCLPQLEDVHWYMDLAGRMKVKILRTFSSKLGEAFFFNHMLDTKYGALPGNVLVIRNFSADDFAVYHCAEEKNKTPRFLKKFRLFPVNTPTLPTNQSEPEFQPPFWQWSHVMIGSLVLHVFLVVLMAVIALVTFRMVKSQQTKDLSPPAPLSPEYEEIVLMAAGNAVPESCVYSQAQMPV